MVTEVLYDQPHYHIVATMPLAVRDSFIRDRILLGWLAAALAQMLNRHLTEGCRHSRRAGPSRGSSPCRGRSGRS